MRPVLAAPVIIGLLVSCRRPGSSDDTTIDTAILVDASCSRTVSSVVGDLQAGIRVEAGACGSLELVDARVIPPGPRLDVFIDKDASQLFPAVTAPEPSVVEAVRWRGTFALAGAGSLRIATWPRQIGEPLQSGPLGAETVEASGAVLLGREPGAWLFVGAIGQRFDEVGITVSPAGSITVTWGGREARRLARDGRAFYDPITIAMGPDPAALVQHWWREIAAGQANKPFGGALSVYGPPASVEELVEIMESDEQRRLTGVLTDGRDPGLESTILSLGRAWMVRGSPFLVSTDVEDGILRREGQPLLIEGRRVLDPTHPDGFERIRRRATTLVNAGADGAWLVDAAVLAVPGDREATDQAGIAAYRLGLEAFRSGFGERPIVVEDGLLLASLGVADALIPADGTDPAIHLSTVDALAGATPELLRFGPWTLSTASDVGFRFDLAVALVSGGTVHLDGPTANATQSGWLFGPDPDDLLSTISGAASRRLSSSDPVYAGPLDIVTLVNPGSQTVLVDGPGGRRWLVDEVASPALRELPPRHAEVWLPARP